MKTLPSTSATAVATSTTGRPAPQADPVCPGCGLTASLLVADGRMGCSRCYIVFEAMVEQAARELHGVTPRPAKPAAGRPSLPWPTRRAQHTLPAAPPPPPPAAPARRRSNPGSRS